MKARLLIALAVGISVAGCATQVIPQATGGSRADGVVNLTYQYGAFDLPEVNHPKALATAAARCAAWGYSDAEAFGGQTTKCASSDLYGGCLIFEATIAYQCTGAGTPGGR